jgi:hypothetical protein
MKTSSIPETILRHSQMLGNISALTSDQCTRLTLPYSMVDYLYVPPTQPMDIEGWPTLAEMIISNKRVVAMLAYDANQQKVRCYGIDSCHLRVSRYMAYYKC